MKTLFVSNDPAILETGSAVRARMRAYAERIGELHIVLPAKAATDECDGPLTIHGVAGGLVSRARELIRSESIAVVSAQDPFEYGWMAVRAVRGTLAKLHIQVHTDFLSPGFTRCGLVMSLKNAIRQLIAGIVLPNADGIRVVSKRVADSLAARYGSRIPASTIIPIAVGTDVPAAVPLPEHGFSAVLIVVGRLEAEKRVDDIIRALAFVGRAHPDAGLVVVGEGRERAQLEALAHELGIGKKVLFLGARADAWGLMQSAQALVQASAFEGYGRTLVEAALAGVPIVTTEVGVVGDVLLPDADVLVVPQGKPRAIAEALARLIEHPEQGKQLAAHAKTSATAHTAAFADLPALIAADLARLL